MFIWVGSQKLVSFHTDSLKNDACVQYTQLLLLL